MTGSPATPLATALRSGLITPAMYALLTNDVPSLLQHAVRTDVTGIQTLLGPLSGTAATFNGNLTAAAASITGVANPSLTFSGDGTNFVGGPPYSGIFFNNNSNYFFGIGTTGDGQPNLLLQGNGITIIRNPSFGAGYVGFFDDSTFGRTEGGKVALWFGTDGQSGLRIFDHSGTHSFMPLLEIDGTTTISSDLTVGRTLTIASSSEPATPATGRVAIWTDGTSIYFKFPNGNNAAITA